MTLFCLSCQSSCCQQLLPPPVALLFQGDRIADVMAVRTAEIDSRIRDAVYLRGSSAASPVGGSGEKQLIGQLVIVGECWWRAAKKK